MASNQIGDTRVDAMFEQRTRGISGSKFTIGFVILLAIGVLIGFVAAFRFQKTMLAFDEVRLKWPTVAASIDLQIASINKQLEAQKAPVDAELTTKWRSAVKDFQESSQHDRQVARLDELLQAHKAMQTKSDGKIGISFPERTPDMESFIEADRDLDVLQTDWLGRMCQMLFGLNLSKRVYQKF